MGIFSRDRSSDDGSSDSSADVPTGDEPGASATQYDDGKGTVGLGDRLGDGAPDTNQGKSEPMPPTAGHADPVGTAPHTEPPPVPDLGDMGAGRAMAQVASPTVLPTRQVVPGETLDAGGTSGGHPGTVPAEDRPQVDSTSSTGRSAGPELPQSQTTGTSHRAPGLQGETPEGESVESDVEAGAARMAPGGAPDRSAPPVDSPGDAQGVGVPHELAAPGTSEESGIAHGVKDPARPQ